MITVVGLALAALSVVVPVVLVLTVNRARLSVSTPYLTPVGVKGPNERVELRVFHDGTQVDQNVFVIETTIENTGSKDITSSEFINPIKLICGPALEPLSVSLNHPVGVEPKFLLEGSSVLVSWDILKPREKIRISVVARQTEERATYKELVAVQTLVRLRDVRIGERTDLLSPFTLAALAFLVAAGTNIWPIFDPEQRTIRAFEMPSGEEFVIEASHRQGMVNLCALVGYSVSNKCKEMPFVDAAEVSATASPKIIVAPHLRAPQVQMRVITTFGLLMVFLAFVYGGRRGKPFIKFDR